ncbi:hypothetical protein P4S68_14370 [Pseudoalteromonas sp. Hal099]
MCKGNTDHWANGEFDIQAQRADKALIEFAKQTEQTVVFSYELAKNYQANSVYGFYTQLDALQALLSGLSSMRLLIKMVY